MGRDTMADHGLGGFVHCLDIAVVSSYLPYTGEYRSSKELNFPAIQSSFCRWPPNKTDC